MPEPLPNQEIPHEVQRLWSSNPAGDHPPDLRPALGDLDSINPAQLAEALRIDALERHKHGYPFGVLDYENALGLQLNETPSAATLFMLHIALSDSSGDPNESAQALIKQSPDRFTSDIECALEQLTTDSEDDQGSVQASPRLHAEARVGQRIGGCKVIEVIDAGAQGVVYKALEHPDHGGDLEQFVAIKVLNTRVVKKSDIARFEAESEFIARLAHPGVARVFRTGRTDDDRPFFVMEYVPGLPITAFADQRTLGIKARLDLFKQVCEAVGHIHQRQLIHRDLKPSNILVTETTVADGVHMPRVKVIDFGLAKSVGARLSQASMVTNLGDVIGTLSYMAPEQAGRDQLDVDQRADVFALGAVLFELLTGQAPLEQSAAEQSSARRNIDIYALVRSVERPSAAERVKQMGERGESIAQRRGLPNANRLVHLLEHELQWIPAYAMRLEPSRRYRTAIEMSDDIDNYLDSRPLIAGPNSRGYRFKKTLRQHRGPIAAATALLVVITAGLVVSSMMFVKAEKASAEAIQRAAELDDAVIFMENLVMEKDPKTGFQGLEGGGRNIMLFDVLKEMPPTIRNKFSSTPETRDRLLTATGQSLVFLGEELEAIPILEGVLVNATPGFLETTTGWDARLSLATALRRASRYEEALDRLQALDELKPPTPALHADRLDRMAIVTKFLKQFDEAEPLYQEAYDAWVVIGGPDSREALNTRSNRALLDLERGKAVYGADKQEAIKHYTNARNQLREVYEDKSRLLGTNDSDTLSTAIELARMHSTLKQFPEAAEMYDLGINGLNAQLGHDHWRTLQAMCNFGSMYARQKEYDKAIGQYDRSLAEYEQQNRLHLDDAVDAARISAICHQRLGRPSWGIDRLVQVFHARKERSMIDNRLVTTVNLLAELCEETGDTQGAEHWRQESKLLTAQATAEPLRQ